MSCRWVNSGSHDRSRGWAITIPFSLGRDLCQARRYVTICNKVKKTFQPGRRKGRKTSGLIDAKNLLAP